MPGNSFGQQFKITTFGESHGAAVGVVIDGCPAGLSIDEEIIQAELDRRRPGQSEITSPRKEEDKLNILSGIFEGKSTGAPIAMLIHNRDQRPGDYSHLTHTWRPGHADFTYDQKYGFRDHRGGGRSSARETAARVMAGAVARQLIATAGIQIKAFVSSVGNVSATSDWRSLDLETIDQNPVRCPDPEASEKMIALIKTLQAEGDTIGGTITCVATGVPAGLGEPVFHKLQADLASAMLGINACKGFEIGDGFAGSSMRGSQFNDLFEAEMDPAGHPRFRTRTNHSGGIQGGISNGSDIVFRAAFKPVSTILAEQETTDRSGNPIQLEGKGRHDPCVVPRAVPIVEAMCALVLADHWLMQRSSRL